MVAGMFLGSGIVLRVVQPLTGTIAAAVIVTAHRYLNEARQKEVLRRSFEALLSTFRGAQHHGPS